METKSREFKSGKGEVLASGLMHPVNPVPRIWISEPLITSYTDLSGGARLGILHDVNQYTYIYIYLYLHIYICIML